MNGSMSAKGELGHKKYTTDGSGVQSWIGRAYWIGEDLKSQHSVEKEQARK